MAENDEINDLEFEILKRSAESRKIPVEQLLEELGKMKRTESVTTERPKPQENTETPKERSRSEFVPEFETVFIDGVEVSPDDIDATESTDGVFVMTDSDEDLPPAAETDTPDEGSLQSEEKLGTIVSLCPHCGMKPDEPPTTVPDRADKLLFLHCILGEQLFTKTYSCFDGAVELTFRTLRAAELDILYQETFVARRRGMLVTTEDAASHMLSLRMYAQLLSVRTSHGLRVNLPDGLTKFTSPDASKTWDSLYPVQSESSPVLESDPTKTLLLQIQSHIVREVLKSDTIVRAARLFNDRFCALISAMELRILDDPFWRPTETPP